MNGDYNELLTELRVSFIGPDCKEQEKTIPIRKLLEEE